MDVTQKRTRSRDRSCNYQQLSHTAVEKISADLRTKSSRVPVAHTCNPSYSAGLQFEARLGK
jgi:hypothetical protein